LGEHFARHLPIEGIIVAKQNAGSFAGRGTGIDELLHHRLPSAGSTGCCINSVGEDLTACAKCPAVAISTAGPKSALAASDELDARCLGYVFAADVWGQFQQLQAAFGYLHHPEIGNHEID